MKHTIRSIKYLILLMLLLLAVNAIMQFTGSVELTFQEQFALFMADGGAMKLAFMVVLAALYPLFGFVSRDVEGSIEKHRDQIDVAMEASGFSFKEEREGELIYRANTILRRVAFLFEDNISVTQRGEAIHIEGVRRGVVYIVYCLDGFIKNSKRIEEEETQRLKD